MKIDFLTTNVGRGHRFYLEGLLRETQRLAPEVGVELFDVSEISHGMSRLAWRAARGMYRLGSRSGYIGDWYNRFRKSRKPGSSSILHSALGRDLKRWAQIRSGVVEATVVDHPLLVELIGSQSNRPLVIYMHGELVAPDESLCVGADLTLVPTQVVRQRFVDSGYAPEQIVVTGLCIESALVPLSDIARQKRLTRSAPGAPGAESVELTGAFFSSGAEPVEHCDQIVRAVLSLQKDSQRSVVFAKNAGRLERLVRPHTGAYIELVTYSAIAKEEELLAKRFVELDYFVAPSHERTNWALGLGLPFFMLAPVFGSFAPLNRELAQEFAAAIALSDTGRDRDGVGVGGGGGGKSIEFAEVLREARATGQLIRMNERWTTEIDGFTRSAELTLAYVRKTSAQQKPR